MSASKEFTRADRLAPTVKAGLKHLHDGPSRGGDANQQKDLDPSLWQGFTSSGDGAFGHNPFESLANA